MASSDYIDQFFVVLPAMVAAYFILSGILWFFFYFSSLNRTYTKCDKLQPYVSYNLSTMTSEIMWSLSTLIVGAFFVTTVFYAYKRGFSYLYMNIFDYGVGYYIVSALVMWLANDAYMYWTHRVLLIVILALHTRLGYKYIHKVHHKFFAPSPFSTMAFHPGEAVIQFTPMLLALLVPLHIPTLIAMGFGLLCISIAEHLGYRISFYERFNFLFSTPIHHDLHHSLLKCNYAVYLTYWDRVMGTYTGEVEWERITQVKKLRAEQSTSEFTKKES